MILKEIKKNLLKKRLERATKARKQAEDLADTKLTEIYQLNQQLNTLNNHLDSSVKSRTAELERQIQFSESVIGIIREIKDFTIFIEK